MDSLFRFTSKKKEPEKEHEVILPAIAAANGDWSGASFTPSAQKPTLEHSSGKKIVDNRRISDSGGVWRAVLRVGSYFLPSRTCRPCAVLGDMV